MSRVIKIQRDAGFTFPELLVVLAIVSLLAILALPVVSRPPQQAVLKATTTTLASQLRLARADAIRNNADRVLTFDTAKRTHWVPGVAGIKKIPNSISVKFRTLERERVTGSQANVRFYPDGSTTGGQFALASGSDRAKITIDWMTGHVGIRYGNRN